jgi:hypothetical protein
MRISERATQVWPVLLFAAFHRQTTEYETLSRLIGVPEKEILSLLLPVQRYCLARGIPDLTTIVTADLSGEPAVSAADARAARIAVFHYPWLSEATPTAADFEPFCPSNQ